jgi:choice-of-anchor A domain-containing protein
MSSKLLLFSALASLVCIANQAQAQSPTAAAQRFNIFVKGDLTVSPNETEGPIAVGGNLISNQYQITFNKEHGVFFVDGVSIGLAVRGGVKLNSGSLKVDGGNYVKIGNGKPGNSSIGNDLRVWYKDNNQAESNIRITDTLGGFDSQPNFIINTNVSGFKSGYKVGPANNPVFENVFGTGPGQIDIDGAFTTLVKRSGQLRDLADNLPILRENRTPIPGAEIGPYLTTGIFDQNPVIKVKPGVLNVLTVSAAVWNSLNNVIFEDMPSGPELGTTDTKYRADGGTFGLIVNIVDFPTFCANNGGNTELKFPNVGGLDDPKSGLIVYNFPDATKGLTLKGAVIWGSILAPQADVAKKNNGNLVGQVIAKSFIHDGHEIHFRPFLPTVAEPVENAIEVAASSKCYKNAPYLDYTVTPNYDIKGKKVKIEWIDSEGKVIQEDNNQELTGSILFPGAALDIDGNGSAWPGWEKVGGTWVEVVDRFGSLRNAGATIRVTIDPWKVISITYPESAGACYTSPPPGNTLPVTLASFTAEKQDCNVQLKWAVNEAHNFSHFIVQRSPDARTFSSQARIEYEDSQSGYSFSDRPFASEAAPARNYYYRLQQVDNDGTFEYSAIRNVDAGTCDARLTVDFYPNPTQDEINIKSFSPVRKVEIFTLGGKKVYQSAPGLHETGLKVNVQALAQGLYIVNVANAEGQYSSKVVKK